MTVQERCKKINNEVWEERFQKFLWGETNSNNYKQCFTSLDVIEDTQDAIEEFISIPEQNYPERSRLHIYGVLQAMFCQQDGLLWLYKIISKKENKYSYNNFFSDFNFDKNIREIRNDIVGHPNTRHNNSEFYFIAKGTNSKYNFTYGGYNPVFTSIEVDLKKMINEQNILALNVLNAVEQNISQFKTKLQI